jgi:bifunctional DNA-binding transcriptional regulator/antitoxin component of YhaV-PrlF toxin-antitoxin module
VTEALFHGFIALQPRGVLALPSEVRRRYGLDNPGAQVEITERPDGGLEVRPQAAASASQDWFWEDEWQQREREASADLKAGRFTDHDSTDAFLADLEGQHMAGQGEWFCVWRRIGNHGVYAQP